MRYGYAILCVVLALGAALALRAFDLEGFIFVIAVAVAVWVGGRAAGVLAIVLSILLLHFVFVAPFDTGAHLTYGYFVVFSVLTVLITAISEARHRAERSLLQARDELEVKVQERTVDLERSNQQLRDEVAERKRAQEDVRRSEAFLAAAQRLSHTGSFGWRVPTGEILWSEEASRIFEYDRTTTTVELILQRTHPEDAACVKETFERASQDGKELDLEHRLLMPDGSVKHVHVVGHAQSDESGELEFVGAVIDITDTKRTEAALREQTSLLSLTHDTIFVRHMDDVITYWNRGAEELYEWTAEQVVGKATTHELLQTVFPAPVDEIQAELLRAGRWEGELLHTKADGTRVVVASRWSLQRDQLGRPLAILELNNDVTERKRAEEALHHAQLELAHVTRVATMGELTASLAHEVNQPLSGVAINGNTCLRWLAADPPNLDEAREAARRVVRDGKRANEVIARIRALTKKDRPEMGRVDINDAIRDVVALAQGELRRSRVASRVELADDLPPVLGDRVQLQQVVLNLVMNGIEAMTAASPERRELVIRTVASEADQVRVAVQDAGVGLDSQNIDQLFEAFYTTKSSGMGMGLSISRTIVASHGGRLWAVPNDGPGATFQFTVPRYAETQ